MKISSAAAPAGDSGWGERLLGAGGDRRARLALVPRAGDGSAKPGGDGKGKDKAVVPLEFVPSEVARPVLATMPLLIEFSGPLVAPRTAVVRAKAPGTLLSPAGRRGQPRQGRAVDRRDRSLRPADPGQRALGAWSNRRRPTLLEAERQHTANVGLASQNFISSTALQTSQARLDAARAQLKSAQAQLFVSRIGVARSEPARADLGHRRQAPRRAGREGERRAAGA